MTTTSHTGGFTIVELMVTLAVAAILMGFALPAFNDFVRQRTMASRINDFVMAVTYARSEAVRRGGLVSVQADAPEADNEWGGGYCVVVGNPGNCPDPADPEVLRWFGPMSAAEVTFDASPGVETLTFNSRGLPAPQLAAAVAVSLCSVDASGDPGRVVNITVTGRPDTEELDCHG